MEGMFSGVVLFVGFLFYILPAWIAKLREHRNTAAIFVLNLFLGWTFIGWVVALVWAMTDSMRPEK